MNSPVEGQSAVLMFSFRADVPLEDQDRMLERIQGWRGVTLASRLTPGESRLDLRRFAYLQLSPDAVPARVLSKLRKLPEIEGAEATAARYLS